MPSRRLHKNEQSLIVQQTFIAIGVNGVKFHCGQIKSSANIGSGGLNAEEGLDSGKIP